LNGKSQKRLAGYKFKKFGLEKSRKNVQLLLMTNYYCSMSYIYSMGGAGKKESWGRGNLERISGFAYKNAHYLLTKVVLH
jgi:hypothetical protein